MFPEMVHAPLLGVEPQKWVFLLVQKLAQKFFLIVHLPSNTDGDYIEDLEQSYAPGFHHEKIAEAQKIASQFLYLELSFCASYFPSYDSSQPDEASLFGAFLTDYLRESPGVMPPASPDKA